MPKIISDIANNPFRILDAYADAGQKQILANKGKFAALASVGKSAGRTLCLDGLLGRLDCKAAAIEEAYKKLYLPQQKVQFALMWFMKPEEESLDNALRNCKSTNVHHTLTVFKSYTHTLSRKEGLPLWLMQDIALLNLLAGQYEDAYIYITRMSLRVDEWLKLIGCEVVGLDADGMIRMFMGIMEREGIDVNVEGRLRNTYKRLESKIYRDKSTPVWQAALNLYEEAQRSLPELRMAPAELDHYYLDIANRVAEYLINYCQETVNGSSNSEFRTVRDKIEEIASYAENIMYGTTLLPKLKNLRYKLENFIGDNWSYQVYNPPADDNHSTPPAPENNSQNNSEKREIVELDDDGCLKKLLVTGLWFFILFLICLPKNCGSTDSNNYNDSDNDFNNYSPEVQQMIRETVEGTNVHVDTAAINRAKQIQEMIDRYNNIDPEEIKRSIEESKKINDEIIRQSKERTKKQSESKASGETQSSGISGSEVNDSTE